MAVRFLVADDDADLLSCIVESLAHRASEIVSATSGADLLDCLAERGPFDLVVADISMPWLNGLQVAQFVREAGLEVPWIVITGLDDPSLPSRIRKLGERTQLLRKPFGLPELESVVAFLLDPPSDRGESVAEN